MGPLEDEAPLERYNRVNTLLKSLQCALAVSKWRPAFKEGRDPFPNTTIGASSILVWMRSLSSGIVIPATIPVQKATAAKSVELRLNRNNLTKWEKVLAQHEIGFIRFEGFSLPSTCQAERNPRVYPDGGMWRDTIRRQLNFAKLRVNFLTMTLKLREETFTIYNEPDPENGFSNYDPLHI